MWRKSFDCKFDDNTHQAGRIVTLLVKWGYDACEL